MIENILYYGDNLDILRRYIKDESVDLIYLDPPVYNNVESKKFCGEQLPPESAVQVENPPNPSIRSQAAQSAARELEARQDRLRRVMQASRAILGENEVFAHLSMMMPRLRELYRALKPAGIIYLHTDPLLMPYLKIIMDAIFGPQNFRNEIIWKRTQPKSRARKRLPGAYDVLLTYAKSERAIFQSQYRKYNSKYVEKFYRFVEPGTGRRYMLDNLTNPKKDRPDRTYEFPPGSGVVRVWRWKKERMVQAWEQGRVVVPKKGKVARYVRYLDEMPGIPVSDVWDDIEPLHGSGSENFGYPSQKPEALLERIIRMSTREGDLVLDPFLGSGTTAAVANRLNRRWMGVDIDQMAISLCKYRLCGKDGDQRQYKVFGEPASFEEAKTLSAEDPVQFAWWALGLVGAQPLYLIDEIEKTACGRIFFHDDPRGEKKQFLFFVKASRPTLEDIRILLASADREKAVMGALITLQAPGEPILTEAAGAGFYNSAWGKYPRLQIITVADLLKGEHINYPHPQYVDTSHQKFSRVKVKDKEQLNLL